MNKLKMIVEAFLSSLYLTTAAQQAYQKCLFHIPPLPENLYSKSEEEKEVYSDRIMKVLAAVCRLRLK